MTKFLTIEEPQLKEPKKTVLTHLLCTTEGWVESIATPEHFEVVLFIGHCEGDGDMFSCYDKGVINIYKGTKGDEFNK